jgi:outer membrane protein TolC
MVRLAVNLLTSHPRHVVAASVCAVLAAMVACAATASEPVTTRAPRAATLPSQLDEPPPPIPRSAAAAPRTTPDRPVPAAPVADVKAKDDSDAEVMPIDLATALRLANVENPTINRARESVAAAYARLDQAQVLWLPDLRVGPAYQRHDGQLQETNGAIFGVSKSNLFVGGGAALGLEVSDALFAPLIARRLAQAQAANAQAVSHNIELDVALAYLDLLRVHGQLAVNADTVTRSKEMLRFAEAADEAGLNKNKADPTRARAEIASRQRERIDLEGDEAVASARLAQLLLLKPTVDLRPVDPAVVPLALVPAGDSLDDLVATALLTRPELAESRELVAAAVARWRQARTAPLIPRLDVSYFGGDFGGGMNSDLSKFSGRSDGLAQVTWALHNFGAGDIARARERRAQVNEANFRVVEVEAQVAAEVVAAAKLARHHQRTLKDAQAAVIEAVETWRRLETAAREVIGGKIRGVDPLEPLIAIQALAQARTQYLDEVIEYNRAQFRLFTALGQPPQDALPKAKPEPQKLPALPIPDKDMPRPK